MLAGGTLPDPGRDCKGDITTARVSPVVIRTALAAYSSRTAADVNDARHLRIVRPFQDPRVITSSHRVNWRLPDVSVPHKIIEGLRPSLQVKSVLADDGTHRM